MTDRRDERPPPAGAGAVLPRELAGFRRFLAFTGRVELFLAVVALVVVVLLSGSQALLRYAFGTSLWWAQEVAENTVLAAYFFGISYVFKTRQYILVEFLSSMAPVKVQLTLYILAQVLTAAFCAISVWLVYLFSPTLFNMRTPVLGLPAFITPMPFAIASAMMVLTSMYYFLFACRALLAGAPGATLHDIERAALVLPPLEDAEW